MAALAYALADIIVIFVWGEDNEQAGGLLARFRHRTRLRAAQQRVELGKHLLDGVDVDGAQALVRLRPGSTLCRAIKALKTAEETSRYRAIFVKSHDLKISDPLRQWALRYSDLPWDS